MPDDMLAELRDDNQRFVTALREAHDVCEEHNDVATTSLLEVYIDEAEKRVWFLYEAGRQGEPSGHYGACPGCGAARSVSEVMRR